MQKTLFSQIADIGIVPVIKLNQPEAQAAPLAEALIAGELPVAEVTFRAEGAARAIRIMSEQYPELIVGAGTVLTLDQVKAAADAGARFVVSPGFNPKTVEYCQSIHMPIFPGTITPTEIELALSYGLEILKFFPAEQAGGLARIKALAAPFNMVKFMPTGGISLENLGTYLRCPAVVACGGSFMVQDQFMQDGQWSEVTRLCLEARAIVRAAKA